MSLFNTESYWVLQILKLAPELLYPSDEVQRSRKFPGSWDNNAPSPPVYVCVCFFKLQCVTWSYTKVVPPSTLTKWPVFDYITQTLLTFWTSEPCLHYGTEVWCCASQCQPIIPFFDTRFIFCDLTEFRRFANRKHSQSDAGMNLAFFKFDRIIGWTIFIANHSIN